MSKDFFKTKTKRSRSSSSEANSFVKNVTSRVSGLLPAAVAKWFGSPSTSGANGSAPVADATDTSSDEDVPESPAAPPSKRMRFTSPGNYNHEATPTSDSIELEPCSPYGSVQSPPGRATFRRETNFASTPLRADEDTFESASKDMTMFKHHSVLSVGSSVAGKRKSLFDSNNSSETSLRAAKSSCNTVRDPSMPCFKPSLLGSPFYPGRTTYGGASASYINHSNVKQRKNALVNDASSCDNTVSASARRIMELLEDYSSPLREAKRIPHYTRVSRNSFNSPSSTPPPSNKTISYKTQELHVPSIASVLRLKQRSRLMDTTSAARQIIASHSSTIDYVPYSIKQQQELSENEPRSKLTIKSRLTRPKRGENTDETDMPTPVNLPTAVLQIDQNNLPKFSLNSLQPTAPITINTPLRKPDIVTSTNPYKFSSPVKLPGDESEPKEIPKFTFGSPDRSVDKVNERKDETPTVINATKSKEPEKSVAIEKDWQCSDCLVFNKPDVEQCVCCSGKKSSQNSKKPAKCKICKLADSQPLNDKCVNCNNIKINNISKPIMKPEESSKWKCGECWVSNESSVDACVCCGAKNAKNTVSVIKQNTNINDKESEWKCDVCWIKNKSSVNKCAACESPKPGSMPAHKPAAPVAASLPSHTTNVNTFQNIAKAQSQKWECSSCLVRNDSDKTRCACCDAEKDGTIKESDKKSFNFGMNTNTTFKFGIDPGLQTSNTTNAFKPIEIKPTETESKKEESETNNNILPKTPSYTFGIPVKKSDDLSAKTEEKTIMPKTTFTFGIPKTAPADTPTFTPIKIAETKTSEKDKEKPQVVPKVNFGLPNTQEAPKPITSIFTMPLPSSQPSQENPFGASIVPEKPVTSTPIVNSTFSLERKDPPTTPSLPQPAATSATPVPQSVPTFSFGSGSGIRLTANLFAPPAAPATTVESFNSLLQSSPATATPLFQKNESPMNSGMSELAFPKSTTTPMFAKSEAPVAAPAPLFSFGAAPISQPQSPQPEKPKFNFTFGGMTKSEAPPLFKPPENKFTFGATENKFGLPPSNTMGGGMQMSSNGMGGGNGLPMGTMITGGNGLPANPLMSGTEMSHNPISGGNGLPASSMAGGIFGSAVQKENMWSNNVFGSNTNSTPKPAGFSFGTSTPFNAAPAFGNVQPTPNVFGMGSSGPNVFGAAPAPAVPMFGTSSPPAFGSPNASMPAFEAPSLTPAPAPAFNFGGQQQAAGVFGFGQSSQPQNTGGVYSFGASQGAPQVQFNMGSAPNAALPQRRIRKAFRRTTQR